MALVQFHFFLAWFLDPQAISVSAKGLIQWHFYKTHASHTCVCRNLSLCFETGCIKAFYRAEFYAIGGSWFSRANQCDGIASHDADWHIHAEWMHAVFQLKFLKASRLSVDLEVFFAGVNQRALWHIWTHKLREGLPQFLL